MFRDDTNYFFNTKRHQQINDRKKNLDTYEDTYEDTYVDTYKNTYENTYEDTYENTYQDTNEDTYKPRERILKEYFFLSLDKIYFVELIAAILLVMSILLCTGFR